VSGGHRVEMRLVPWVSFDDRVVSNRGCPRMEIRVAEDTLPCAKTAPHPSAFLSEVVQYWTAIYPELTHHQKAQSTLKPILPQERNR